MRRRFIRLKCRTKLMLCLICIGTLIYLSEKTNLNYYYSFSSPKKKLPIEGQACRVPTLDVYAPEIMELLHEPPKVDCNTTTDWVKISGSTAKIVSWAKKNFHGVACSFTDILRENDFHQYQGMTTTTHTEYNLENSDVVYVYCKSKSGVDWKKVLLGVRSDQDIFDRASWSEVPSDSLKLNVLMFGFDSLSHSMWKRKLPKTYKYATEDLNGIALNGYNILGDGTPQALIPILTGKTEQELPDTRKRMRRKAQFLNVYPFIWKDYQKNGYVTAYSEDMIRVGTFNYRLKGFNKQPVDHYTRHFYASASPFFKKKRPYCYGELSNFQIMLSYVENIYEVYKDRPKFSFSFHGEYSHESNDMVSNADNDTLKWLQDFNKKGYLNDTLLILMSDHGSRFSQFRNTMLGKLEERLPGFIFVFPKWFSGRYPEAYKNFKINVDRLTTPFDIHETLKNVLHFEGAGMGSTTNRGISLFKEVPLSRTCSDAGIDAHWCTCLEWEKIPVTSEIVTEVVHHFLNTVNSYTADHRNLCSELHLKEIIWSAKLIPNEDVLKYKGSSDIDGFIVDLSDHTKISIEIYQIKVSLNPGNMLFEASVKYYIEGSRFKVSEKDISRLNKYSNMTHCIEDRDILHHLRKYCYCLYE